MGSGLFKKDFTLVVIGQIISLFGNAAIRFAMPLYLLNETGSSALFGTVTFVHVGHVHQRSGYCQHPYALTLLAPRHSLKILLWNACAGDFHRGKA